MKAIFEGARAWYKGRGTLPGLAGWTPNGPGVCCGYVDTLCEPAKFANQWMGPWLDLGFSMKSRFRYSYQFTPKVNPLGFTIEASADFSCDGRTFSHYQIDGALVNGDFTGINNVIIQRAGE